MAARHCRTCCGSTPLATCCREVHIAPAGRSTGSRRPAGSLIVPLNHTLIDDTIVLRTSPYSELAQHSIGKDAAFEIDEVDHTRRTGWNVVAVGMLEEVEPADLESLRTAWVPQPWAGGQRTSTCGFGGARSAGAGSAARQSPRRLLAASPNRSRTTAGHSFHAGRLGPTLRTICSVGRCPSSRAGCYPALGSCAATSGPGSGTTSWPASRSRRT